MSVFQMEQGNTYSAADERVAQFIGKVYGTLALCMMACTGICAYAVQHIQVFAPYSRVCGFVLLGMMLLAAFVRLSGVFAWGLLIAYVSLIGVMIAPLISIMTRTQAGSTTVAAALGLTGIIFLALTAYVRISGKSFTFMGGFLWMATIALILTGVALMFWPNSDVYYWKACIGAIIFSGWILYDTSAVTEIHYPNNNIPGAVLALFCDLVNLFLNLLTILRGRN